MHESFSRPYLKRSSKSKDRSLNVDYLLDLLVDTTSTIPTAVQTIAALQLAIEYAFRLLHNPTKAKHCERQQRYKSHDGCKVALLTNLDRRYHIDPTILHRILG